MAHLMTQLAVGAGDQYVHKGICLYSSAHLAWTEQEGRNRFPVQETGFPAYISSGPPIRGMSFSIVSFFSSRAAYWAWRARKRWQSDPIIR